MAAKKACLFFFSENLREVLFWALFFLTYTPSLEETKHLPHLWRCLLYIHSRKLTCPLKRDYFSKEYIFQPLIFRGHVSFQGSSQTIVTSQAQPFRQSTLSRAIQFLSSQQGGN